MLKAIYKIPTSNTRILQPIQQRRVTLLPQLRPARLGFEDGVRVRVQEWGYL